MKASKKTEIYEKLSKAVSEKKEDKKKKKKKEDSDSEEEKRIVYKDLKPNWIRDKTNSGPKNAYFFFQDFMRAKLKKEGKADLSKKDIMVVNLILKLDDR
jgi:hypothetical protein